MKQLVTIITLTILLVGSAAAVSSGGVKTIEPEQFIANLSNASTYLINPFNIRSYDSTTPASFYSMVKLPKGRTVKKLTFYYYGYTATDTPYAYASLYRRKMGQPAEIMAVVASVDTSSSIIPVESTVINFAKIKGGYKYWVDVYSANWNSFIHGVKITYN